MLATVIGAGIYRLEREARTLLDLQVLAIASDQVGRDTEAAISSTERPPRRFNGRDHDEIEPGSFVWVARIQAQRHVALSN
jgi:hypothetical protein